MESWLLLSISSASTVTARETGYFKMKWLILAAVLVASGYSHHTPDHGSGPVALPPSTSYLLSGKGYGIVHQGTIINNNKHLLDGTAYAAKNFGSHGIKPDQSGGRVDYHYKPSASTAFVSADHARNYGTDVSAGVKHNLFKHKDLTVQAVGAYKRHFGGPEGTGKRDSYIGIQAEAKFN